MTVVVTHTTPADSTFSSTGAAAWNADHALSGVGTMAEQNKTSVDIEGGTIDSTVIGGTTPAAGTFTTLTATGQTSLGGVTDVESFRVSSTGGSAGSNNYLWAIGSSTSASLYTWGTSSNVPMLFRTRGSGQYDFATGSSAGTIQARISHTASAVNYVQVTGAATGASPTISVLGSDTTQTLTLQGRGSAGGVNLGTGFGTNFRAVGFAGSTIVNNLQAQGSATGIAPVFSSTGTDTNIAQVFQSKGTGAIDLAAGSSGVNISNGGTVTAITRTATSGGYTSAPTITVSAPTTAGGVQATVTGYIWINSVTLASGGTGYTVGDVLSIAGGSYVTNPVRITVTGVSAGVITSFTFVSFDLYNTAPSNPASVTGGTGSGATFTLNFSNSSTYTITNAGSGYVEQPTVSFSGGGGSGAAAYATVGGTPIIKGLGSNLDFYTANAGIGMRLEDTGGVATGYFRVRATTGAAQLLSTSSMSISSSGANNISLLTNGISQEQLRITHTASAVNYVQVTGAATGGRPTISAQGSDTNIDLTLTPKGTGLVRFGTYTAGAPSATGYISIKAADGTTYKVLVGT